MLERIEKLQIAILGLLLAFGLILAVHIATTSFNKNSVDVTGSAYEIIESDSGVLEFCLKVQAPTKAQSYTIAKKQLPEVIKYLETKKIDTKKDINLKSVDGYYTYKTLPNGNVSNNEYAYYNFSQNIVVKSDDVNTIKDISLDISSLMDKGIDIDVISTNYSYSGLSDLKVKLLKEATQDAKQRASAMLKATNNRVGKIESVKMGVFQITPVDSTDVSDMGINDTSTIEKKITAVANVSFRVK